MKFSYFKQGDIREIRSDHKAKLIRLDISSGRYKFCTKRYNILELGNFVNANNVEYEFVKDNINDENKYFVRVVESSKDLIIFDKNLGGFETNKILGPSINNITRRFIEILRARLLNVIFHVPDTNSVEVLKFRFNIYFGREFFSNIEKENFTPNEWIKYRNEPEKNIPTFYHHAPQFLKKLPKLQGEFKFNLEEREEDVMNRRKIFIYFNHGIKRRMAKLKYIWEDSLWILTELRDINVLANLDVISGTEEPDFRFSVRIRCETHDAPIISKIEKLVNKIYIKNPEPKDGMWFQVKDFEGELENVEIRQTISKKRFNNENYKISVLTLKKESRGKLSDQSIISLENLEWRDLENKTEISYGDVYNTIFKSIRVSFQHILTLK
ncbi:hypothetical protein RclHR1_00490029 [Rhizophagus clarus]|uniref:Uncharacterized protein n=1 Tax=Rhizophagus clarus TaxID=94130 RepID=A0A2Z6RPW2_9GLOM|nr:hypothetical protein RclHR1_00490029 [Rhizophagus clarus]